jgi:hypothetical protein
MKARHFLIVVAEWVALAAAGWAQVTHILIPAGTPEDIAI